MTQVSQVILSTIVGEINLNSAQKEALESLLSWKNVLQVGFLVDLGKVLFTKALSLVKNCERER